MASDLLGISVSGLKISQTGLRTVGHNIANADTEGYSRQRTDAVTNPASFYQGSWVGNGANISNIERTVNQFITTQLRTDTTLFHDMDSFYTQVTQLDNLLSDESTGLTSGLNNFFNAVQNGADDPTSLAARQLVISEADNLSDRFNTVYSRMQTIDAGTQAALKGATAKINALAANIAQLNSKIGDVWGSSRSQPNDLLDKRDLALKELSALVPVQVYDQGGGHINVAIGTGQSLVLGVDANALELKPRSSDPTRMDILVNTGNRSEVITDSLTGGEIGGLLRFSDQIMQDAYNHVGRMALGIADSFNKAHAQGLDLDSQFGGLFFNDINDPQLAGKRVIGAATNRGGSDSGMALFIRDAAQLTGGDYSVSMHEGGLYRITRASDNTEVASGTLTGRLPLSVSFDGMELQFQRGSFPAGEKFTLQPARGAAEAMHAVIADGAELAFASPLSTQAHSGNTGSGRISAGEVTAVLDAQGNPVPPFTPDGDMEPPLVVVFRTPTTYDVLDNSDPANPVHLDPPIRDQRFVPGSDNPLFSGGAGQTQITTAGQMIGLPAGRVATTDPALATNGYPAEMLSISRPSSVPGQSAVTHLSTDQNASARQIASQLGSIPGVTANAFTSATLSDPDLTLASPLQIELNGEPLLPYEIDPVSGANVLAGDVPDPDTDPDAFNDYLSARINANPALKAAGIYASAGTNPATGAPELRVHASEGDDLRFGLTGAPGDTLGVSDSENPAAALTGAGAGATSSIAVGGQLDITLAAGMSLATPAAGSMLFGNTAAAEFAVPAMWGIQASISGTPAAGDRFTLSFNSNAAMDNRNALNLAALQDAKTLAGGSASFSQSYGSLVEKVGTAAHSAKLNREAAQHVMNQSESLRESISGVNLDEEAADLIRFEQLFSANAQVISVARDIFERLINSF